MIAVGFESGEARKVGGLVGGGGGGLGRPVVFPSEVTPSWLQLMSPPCTPKSPLP